MAFDELIKKAGEEQQNKKKELAALEEAYANPVLFWGESEDKYTATIDSNGEIVVRNTVNGRFMKFADEAAFKKSVKINHKE
jgi:hypothetical protein